MKLTIKGTGQVGPPTRGGHCDTSDIATYVPARRLRRIDHFTRMTLLAAHRALDDADMLETRPDRLGIILSTGYGPSQTTFDFLDSIIEDGAPLASPLAFSHSVHNIPAGVLSMLLGTPCPQTTICQLRAPVMTGLQTAAIWLAEGRADSILFGAVDEATPLLEDNTARLSRSARHVSEGGAFFLLDAAGTGYAELDLAPSDASGKGTADRDFGHLPVAAALQLARAVTNLPTPTLVSEGDSVIALTGARDA